MSKKNIVSENKGITRPLDINIIHGQYVRFIKEEIRHLFWIHLVTCPDCSCILSDYDWRLPNNVYCPVCKIDIEEHDCPDLFY